MNKETEAIRNDLTKLAEDARALMAVTADVANEKVTDARKRLATTLDRGKEIYGRVRTSALDSARKADAAVREHPYEMVAVGIGIGAILGALLACQRRSPRD